MSVLDDDFRYAFDLERQRFDIEVMTRLTSEEGPRRAYDRLLDQVADGSFDDRLPRQQLDYPDLADDIVNKAAKNIIDFHFEPYLLASISADQLRNYFNRVEKTLPSAELDFIEQHRPLWIDTVHHACIFSVIYKLADYLITDLGFRALILLHQGLRPEPRLDMFARLLHQTHGVRPLYIQLREQWTSSLMKATTPDTMIIYLSDMPPQSSTSTASGTSRGRHLELDCATDRAIDVETESLLFSQTRLDHCS